MAKQVDLILLHMKKHGSITHLEAEHEYGIARLASRITDLRQMGVAIKSEMVVGKNRRGEKTHYARYSLVSEAAGNA
ncbi:MAG: helix-turn-helix domain-containing protein [Oscillospiraceae bacterium]|nr:helix-turn-helix domain-containing protein [Oscillospiraceae bacterium]